MADKPPRKKKSKVRTVYNPKAIQRMHQAWELYCLGYSIFAISEKLGCHWETSKKDVLRAREMCDAGNLRRVEDAREDAIRARRGLQQLALEDRAEAAPQHRGPLLGEARKNQQGIEELQQLHPKEAPQPLQAGVFLVKVGDAEPQQLKDLPDEELARLAALSDEEMAQLAEPAAETPPDP